MRKPNDQLQKLIVAVIITSLFLIFHQFTSSSSEESEESNEYYYETKPQAMQESFFSRSRSKIIKIPNSDASLSIPYLDKINKYWHIGGSTQVRNSESVKLTSKNVPHTHGSIISNGIGDNTMNDFEVVFDFKLTYDDPATIGDGVAFVITSENGFLLKDLTSSFAMRQYMLNSGGIMANDISMMGFPQNLPGLALVIDTFANDPLNQDDIPFLDIFVNFNPQKHSYHIESDGHRSSNRKLNDDHIRLKKNILQNDRIKLRIIYMESISFLKIDIQYETEGNYWIELYQNNDDDSQGIKHFLLPKNHQTGQRFIGMSALNGDLTENVELFNIKTSEFHWNNGDESMEDTFDYYKECENFLLQEFNQRITMEKDSYTRWKMLKSQPNYKDQLEEKLNNEEDAKQKIEPPQGIRQRISIPKSKDPIWWKILKLLGKWIIIFTIIIALYLLSIYLRVSKKHWKKLQSKRSKRSSQDYLLPI
ncbi:hypothetical protein MOUN0_M03202 [Monosporozyma unispora]|nr:hypothetical protein C6P44_004268 [Kazachstania unispora]